MSFPGLSSSSCCQAHQPCPVLSPSQKSPACRGPRTSHHMGHGGWGASLQGREPGPVGSSPRLLLREGGDPQPGKPHAVSHPSSMRGNRPPASWDPPPSGPCPPLAHPLPRAGGLIPTRNMAMPSAPQTGPHTPDPAPGPHPHECLSLQPPLTRRHLSHRSHRSLWPLSPLPLPQGGSPTTCCNSASRQSPARPSTASTASTAPTGSPPHAPTPHAHLGRRASTSRRAPGAVWREPASKPGSCGGRSCRDGWDLLQRLGAGMCGHVCPPACAHTPLCVFTCVVVCIHVYKHVCVLVCVHACRHICVSMHSRVCDRVCACVLVFV